MTVQELVDKFAIKPLLINLYDLENWNMEAKYKTTKKNLKEWQKNIRVSRWWVCQINGHTQLGIEYAGSEINAEQDQ